jgi:Arm DNA-binding domain
MAGSVRKRGSTWSVRYDEPTDDGGRRQRRRGGFATRREAQGWLAEQTRRIRDNVYVPPSRLTVATFSRDEWLPHAERTLRPMSARAYAAMVRPLHRPRDRPQAPADALRWPPQCDVPRAREARAIGGHDPPRACGLPPSIR